MKKKDYIGGKLTKRTSSYKKVSKEDEARDILSRVILGHVPVVNYDFRPKYIYLALMIRLVIKASHDSSSLDDKDYYGNKRLEL